MGQSGSVQRNFPGLIKLSAADVFRAPDELLVQGDRPTIDRVRMRLGRGSPNTINDHLDAWWSKLGSRLRDLRFSRWRLTNHEIFPIQAH